MVRNQESYRFFFDETEGRLRDGGPPGRSGGRRSRLPLVPAGNGCECDEHRSSEDDLSAARSAPPSLPPDSPAAQSPLHAAIATVPD